MTAATGDYTPAMCEDFLRDSVRTVGLGFHPDTPFAEYVDDAGGRAFGDETAAVCEADLARAFELLGERVYDICADEQRRLMGAADE